MYNFLGNRLILFESLYCTLKCRNLLDMYIFECQTSNVDCLYFIPTVHCSMFYVRCASMNYVEYSIPLDYYAATPRTQLCDNA